MVFKCFIIAHRCTIIRYIKLCMSLQERDLELEMGDDYILDLQSKCYISLSIIIDQ